MYILSRVFNISVKWRLFSSTLTLVRKFSRCISSRLLVDYIFRTCVINSIARIIFIVVWTTEYGHHSVKRKIFIPNTTEPVRPVRVSRGILHVTQITLCKLISYVLFFLDQHSLTRFLLLHTWDFWRLAQASIIDLSRKRHNNLPTLLPSPKPTSFPVLPSRGIYSHKVLENL